MSPHDGIRAQGEVFQREARTTLLAGLSIAQEVLGELGNELAGLKHLRLQERILQKQRDALGSDELTLLPGDRFLTEVRQSDAQLGDEAARQRGSGEVPGDVPDVLADLFDLFVLDTVEEGVDHMSQTRLRLFEVDDLSVFGGLDVLPDPADQMGLARA